MLMLTVLPRGCPGAVETLAAPHHPGFPGQVTIGNVRYLQLEIYFKAGDESTVTFNVN